MNKYQILCNILDTIIKEAPSSFKKNYRTNTPELIDASRSLAYIHLFLKAKFGLIDFKQRHDQITDGSKDGGIDAFHFDNDNQIIYLIQSKFRTNESNFESKDINPDEIAAMDIDRIISGELENENHIPYNGKIRKFQELYSELNAKYKLQIIILANQTRLTSKTIRRLVENHPYTIFDYTKTYNEIVFPICSGNYYDPNEISIEINTETGSKSDSYQYIQTKYGEYSVRLLFAPLVEIGKKVSQYKNSLLKYNPRNFLSLSTNPVNKDIMNEILIQDKNTFALLNNGITFVAESDDYQDKTGKKGIGRLKLNKPQIINGGQTAYAIARLLEDGHSNKMKDKSVLIKVITPEEGKSLDIKLLEAVSAANNRQSKIVEADRRSNAKRLIEIQSYIYKNYDLFFERKRGEFEEGIRQKYIKKEQIIDRVDFVRSVLAFMGKSARSRTSQDTIFEEEFFVEILAPVNIDSMIFAYLVKQEISSSKIRPGETYAIIAALGSTIDSSKLTPTNCVKLIKEYPKIITKWTAFIKWASSQSYNSKYKKGNTLLDKYFKAEQADKDIQEYFSSSGIVFKY